MTIHTRAVCRNTPKGRVVLSQRTSAMRDAFEQALTPPNGKRPKYGRLVKRVKSNIDRDVGFVTYHVRRGEQVWPKEETQETPSS